MDTRHSSTVLRAPFELAGSTGSHMVASTKHCYGQL